MMEAKNLIHIMMKIQTLILLLAGMGVAAATPLPDYPLIYSPAVGGPVANPDYARISPSLPAAPKQTPGSAVAAEVDRTLPNTGQNSLPPVPRMPRYMRSSSYELDITGAYGFKAAPDNFFSCDMVGAELEGAYYFAKHHAFTLSLGIMGGGRTEDLWVIPPDGDRPYPFTDSYDRMSFTLMAGYRYSQRIGRYMLLQVGAKCGMDVQTLDIDYGYGWSGYPYGDYNDWGPDQSDTAVGMGYAGYVNVGFYVSTNVVLHVGYQFRGSTARPKADYEMPGVPVEKVGTMRWHEVRLGFLIRF